MFFGGRRGSGEREVWKVASPAHDWSMTTQSLGDLLVPWRGALLRPDGRRAPRHRGHPPESLLSWPVMVGCGWNGENVMVALLVGIGYAWVCRGSRASRSLELESTVSSWKIAGITGKPSIHERATDPRILAQYESKTDPWEDGIVPVLRLQVGGLWRPLDDDWASLELSVLLQGDWVQASPESNMIVARRYSGSRNNTEAPALLVISALKRWIRAEGVCLISLEHEEQQVIPGTPGEMYRYWAVMGSSGSVAIVFDPDGEVRFKNIPMAIV